MQFVEEHLTKQHLFHKPHRWFLAFLVSPFHAAEVHYKHKYHLTFRHAKKLFVFDMVLLLSVLVLAVASVFWYRYDPTVLDLVSLSIRSSESRIESGQYVTYTFSYTNHSDATLVSSSLALQLPLGFDIDTAVPAEQFHTDSQTFTLKELAPGANGEVRISGWFFDTPDEQNGIVATLAYRQLDRDVHEVKARQTLTTLRGSVLRAELVGPEALLDQGTATMRLTITNDGSRVLEDITIPLQATLGFVLEDARPNAGRVENAVWAIPSLAPGASAVLEGRIVTRLGAAERAVLAFLPSVRVGQATIPQERAAKEFRVLHPRIILEPLWDAVSSASPGDTPTLAVRVQNDGDSPLESLRLSFTLPSAIVDSAAMGTHNVGRRTGDTFTITADHRADLQSLLPGESRIIPATIPIRHVPEGTDVELVIPVQLTAHVRGTDGGTYQGAANSNSLDIGTQLLVNAEARYFTPEGDQLGRGPLPPEVGKETKYWVLLRLTNTTSDARNMRLSAELAPGVTWTGRASVSHGVEPTVNGSGVVTWSLAYVPAHTSVGIHAELSVTPTEGDRGTIPALLQNIRASMVDTVTGRTLERSHRNIDASLTNDALAQERGVVVE